MTFLDRIVEASGISEADIREVTPHPSMMAYIVRRWNHRRVIVTAYKVEMQGM